MTDLIWLVVVIPFAAGIVNLLAGKRLGNAAGWLGALAVVASLAWSVAIAVELAGLPAEERTVVESFGDWISVGSFRVAFDVRIDQLSVLMMLVITGVGSLIHVYSIGYMEGDDRFGRYFAYLNLFVGFMLTLVLANNFLLLYLGWEGVGLCSYLLIGFYQDRKLAGDAAKKAFITTRIGDTAMLIGIALIFIHVGSLDFDSVLGADSGITKGVATAIALLLFAGAVGKSAQVPLHVWLPDAMVGPSPVSALIHAATMVTAGVYLVVRSHGLFELSGVALTVVMIVGLVTLLYGGLGALGQDDLKRSLAYSTISQLGYMFFAAGMGEYGGAMFMLAAHAGYKALLFLTAGNVMHGAGGELDMKRMGGLRRAMPVTAVLFSIGAISLAGIPPLAGFFAKDHIINYAAETGRAAAWILALVGALLSALYAGRMMFLTFFGERRSDLRGHEAIPLMNAPLVGLAAIAVLGGLLGISVSGGVIVSWLDPVTGVAQEGAGGLPALALFVISAAVALAGFALAWLIWGSGRIDWLALRMRLGGVHPALESGLGVDGLYSAFVQTPGRASAAFLAFVVDARWIDGLVDGIGARVRSLAGLGSALQTGLVRRYALAVLFGVVAILVYVGVRL